MALQFTEHDQVRFRHAPLASVLCQIRFPPIFSLATAVGVTGFQEAIRSRYPSTDTETGAQVDLSPQQVNIQQTAPTWRFTSDDGSWRVGLGVDFMSLETPSYTEFADFQDRLQSLLSAIERTVHPGPSTRIGLRKVNQISKPVRSPEEWEAYVKPELLGALSIRNFPAPVVFAFSDLRFADGDCELAVRHGLHPTEEGTYVVDMDYWTESSYVIAATPELRQLFRDFSAGMTSFFHFIAQPRLISEMEPYPKEEGGR